MKLRKSVGLLSLALLLATNSSSVMAASVGADNLGVNSSGSDAITPQYWSSYEKTVVRFYSSPTSIPTSIYYSEYNNGFGGQFSGTLYLVSVVRNSNGSYNATYSGNIGGEWK